MKPIITWIVIADYGKARFVENTGVGHGLTAVDIPDLKAPEKETYQSPPGRSYDSMGQGRHNLEANHGRAVTQFVKDLLERLEGYHEQNRFDRLIICAAPRMLGEIRSAIKPQLKQSVYAELEKDLVNIKLNDLPKHLQNLIAL